MKTNFKKTAIVGTLSLIALGVVSASAMSFGGADIGNLTADELAARQSAIFQKQATLIGATLDDVKQAWAEGKDFKTLAEEKGVTKEQLQVNMKAWRDEMIKEKLATLVNKGIITQDQADKRLVVMNSKNSTTKTKEKHNMRRWF